MNVYESLMFG